MRALPILSLLVAGCAVDHDRPELIPSDAPGSHQPASLYIYGGSAPDAPEHEAVVSLHELDGAYITVLPFCSGTLIAPDVILTAAHCLDVAKGGKPSFKTMNPSDLAIYVGNDPSVDIVDHAYVVTETVIHPGYDRFSLRNDLALVRLAAPVVEAAPVAHLPSSDAVTALDIGAAVNFAGFGEIEDGSWGVKLQADGVLGGLGCSVPGCSDAGYAESQVSYDQSGESGPCFGDSGGPMFITRDGVPYVAGITSYGDAYCTLYGVSTKVDFYDGYIQDFIGVDPGTGGTGTGTGTGGTGTGTGGAICGDGVCDVGESCDGRGATDACSDDCPGRTTGRPSSRFCWVDGVCTGPGC